jgi:hypothetical protein
VKPLVVALFLLCCAAAVMGEEQWLVLRGLKAPHERVLSARPALPASSVRAAFPIEVNYCKSFRPAANGLPADEAELRGLYEHEEGLRALAPRQEVFLQALRETSNGRKCRTHYTKDRTAFRKLLVDAPLSANIVPAFKNDESWSALNEVLARTRR